MNTDMNCDIPHPKTIIHIDIDCFYAQVEMILNPSLKGRPVGIKQKNLLVTCNYKAREMGIRKYMPLKDAMQILSSLVIVDGSDLTNYRKFSSDIFQVLQSYTNLVEKLGFDENFIDVSDLIEENSNYELCNKVYGIENQSYVSDNCGCGCFDRIKAGAALAKKIRVNINETTGLTCCAGIAHNKLLAKLASSKNKPNNQTIVFPWQASSIMDFLSSANDIPGIGNVTFKALNKLGIYSVADLQKAPLTTLSLHFSPKMSESLICLSNGEDSSIVRPSGRPSSLGVEESFMKVSSLFEVKEKLSLLTGRLIVLLEGDGRRPGCIRVTVRKFSNKEGHSLYRKSKQVPIDMSVFSKSSQTQKSEYVSNIAFNTSKDIIDLNKPFHLTLLGLSFGKLQPIPDDRGSIIGFFKKRRSESNMQTELINPSLTSQATTSTASNVTETINNIGLKEVCANFRTGIKLGDTASSSILKQGCKLPSNIDQSVFDVLPVDIQKEILLHNYDEPNSMVRLQTTTRHDRVSTNNKCSLKQTKLSDFFGKK